MTNSLHPDALLTIIVPTYNRADKLELLLTALRSELAGLASDVQVVVSDNASSDRTPELTQAVQAEWPDLVVRRQATNVGADENFCSCVDLVRSRYFWIMGDDDLPKTGVLRRLVMLLRERNPWLVYMQSEWFAPVTGPDQGVPVDELHVHELDTAAFARRVHIWFTFISGIVINREELLRCLGDQTIRRFTGSNLVQLGWILPLLRAGGRYAFVEDRCILATKDNSGGYALLTVFGVNFPRTVKETLGASNPLTGAILRRSVLHYLPGLIWGGRGRTATRHQAESPWPGMRRELGDLPMFWLLLVPLGRFPRWLAQPFYQSWRVFHRLNRELQRLSHRLQYLAAR
jgi:abequosyltransferase